MKNKITRREFIKLSGKTACACSMIGTSLVLTNCGESSPTSPADTTGESKSFNLDEDRYTVLKTVGGSAVTTGNTIDSRGLLLYRETESNIIAYTRKCTHAGYEMLAFQNGKSYCSSGHGGEFNLEGQAISPPATGSLKEYETELNENILTVFGG